MKIKVWENRKPLAWFAGYYGKALKKQHRQICALRALGDAKEAAGDAVEADRIRREEKEAIGALYYRGCCDACKQIGVELTVTGQENLPPAEQPVVYVANHQAYADVFAFGCALGGRQISFIAKQALEKVPLYGKLMEDLRCIFIPADDIRSHVAVINRGVEQLRQGFSMAIFPEGKRSWGREMGAFKKGSFQLACRAGVPIVPVAIEGSYDTFESSGVISPAHIRFSILKPVETADVPKKDWNDVAEAVEATIRAEVLRLQNEEALRPQKNS